MLIYLQESDKEWIYFEVFSDIKGMNARFSAISGIRVLNRKCEKLRGSGSIDRAERVDFRRVSMRKNR